MSNKQDNDIANIIIYRKESSEYSLGYFQRNKITVN